jgi:hypothetical protein
LQPFSHGAVVLGKPADALLEPAVLGDDLLCGVIGKFTFDAEELPDSGALDTDLAVGRL